MRDILVLVTENDQLGKLATLLKLDQASLAVLVVGDRALADEAASVAASVQWIDSKGKPAEAFAAAAAQAIEQAAPKAVVAIATPGARAACGMVACAWEAPTISNAISINVNGDTVRVEHTVLEGKVIETVDALAPVVVLVDALALQADETSEDGSAAIEEIAAEGANFVEVTAVEAAEESALQDAEIVVAVGRGIASGEAFDKAKQLCDAIGAEIGCSMPVSNELELLPQERYIGISGKRIDPKLYIGLGISGLPQHVMGMKNARAIVVVNKDPKAFFFENADYGIVGDVNEVIPELERALKAAM